MYDVVTFRCEQRKLSEMTKHCQLCLAVLLLFLRSVASVIPSLYVVTRLSSSYDGVYKERREPELHFKRLGRDDWRETLYRALAVDGRPAIAG